MNILCLLKFISFELLNYGTRKVVMTFVGVTELESICCLVQLYMYLNISN